MQQFANVDEVFCKLPVPEVQSLEVELRAQAAQKRSELRFLVGESYRDLLTTADTIVSMRDATILLRRQLSTVIAACDSREANKRLHNSSKLLTVLHAAKQNIILQFMADLRSLVCHFLRRGELVTSARLYSLGRILNRSLIKEIPEVGQRLRSVRAVLTRAINKCVDIQEFSCAFAILESAGPLSCLKYFLTLQANKFISCRDIKELTNLVLKTIDLSREFNRLSESFESIATRPLVESLRELPTLNIDLLTKCLEEDVRQYRPYLRADDLTPAMASTHVTQWIEASVIPLSQAAIDALREETQIENVFRLGKDVRNDLDEASQIHIFRAFKPAIEQHTSDLLKSSLATLHKQRELLHQVLNHTSSATDIWTNSLPWTRGSLLNFKNVTKKLMRGDSTAFAAFERSYTPAIKSISTNLEVLEGHQEYRSHQMDYTRSIDETFSEWFQYLHSVGQGTTDKTILICVLRLLSFLTRTCPVQISSSLSTVELYRKLIPQGAIRQHSTYALSKTFEDSSPVSPTSAVSTYLLAITSAVSLAGIDIAGAEERAAVRELIMEALRAHMKAMETELKEDHSGTNASPDDIQNDGHLEQSTIDECVKSTGFALSEDAKDEYLPETANKLSNHSEATPNELREAEGQLESEVQRPAIGASRTGSLEEFEPNKSAPSDVSATRLQAYFDYKFVHDLLRVDDRDDFLHLLDTSRTITGKFNENVTRAIKKHKVLFGAILE